MRPSVPDIFHNIRRYLKLYRVFLFQNLKEDMIYRSNFITLVIMDIGFVGISVILFKIIYSHVNTIAGWTFDQSLTAMSIPSPVGHSISLSS